MADDAALGQMPTEVIPVVLVERGGKCQVRKPLDVPTVEKTQKIIWSVTNACSQAQTVTITIDQNLTTNKPNPASFEVLVGSETVQPDESKQLVLRVKDRPGGSDDGAQVNEYKYTLKLSAGKPYDPEIYVDWPGNLLRWLGFEK